MKLWRWSIPLLMALLILSACSGDKQKNRASDTSASFDRAGTPAPALEGTNPAGSVSNAPVSPLNAGEIDDNAAWDAHLNYRSDYLRGPYGYAVHDVDVSQRQRITVTDPQGLPIIGARVMVYLRQTLLIESRTYANGQAMFFPSAWMTHNEPSYRVVVQKDQTAVEFTLDPTAGTDWHVQLDATRQADSIPLDVLFLLDSTGSMADEIAQLQNNILSIAEQLNQIPGHVDTRYGLVTYRDRGDDYVTLTYDFVADVTEFQTSLRGVAAAGGGDTPESLNEALHIAVQGASWRGDDTIKLIFLVADAAPHLDYANDYDYAQEMLVAAWDGIKIEPIASSGLTPDGEFIFRQLAQYTLGRFLFLTYQAGTSGAPGTQRTDLEASTDNNNYTVEQLDDLVLRLITDEIAALSVPATSQGTSPATTPTNPYATNPLPAYFPVKAGQANVYAQSYPYAPADSSTDAKTINERALKKVGVFFALVILSGVLFGIFLMGAVLGGRFNSHRHKAKRPIVLVRVDEDGEMRQIN